VVRREEDSIRIVALIFLADPLSWLPCKINLIVSRGVASEIGGMGDHILQRVGASGVALDETDRLPGDSIFRIPTKWCQVPTTRSEMREGTLHEIWVEDMRRLAWNV
jgi:hypothetical protein